MNCTTIPYVLVAQNGELVDRNGRPIEIDGRVLGSCDVEVLDLDTGVQPVDAAGRRHWFQEVDAEAGFGMAFASDGWGMPMRPTARIDGRFQLRVNVQ